MDSNLYYYFTGIVLVVLLRFLLLAYPRFQGRFGSFFFDALSFILLLAIQADLFFYFLKEVQINPAGSYLISIFVVFILLLAYRGMFYLRVRKYKLSEEEKTKLLNL